MDSSSIFLGIVSLLSRVGVYPIPPPAAIKLLRNPFVEFAQVWAWIWVITRSFDISFLLACAWMVVLALLETPRLTDRAAPHRRDQTISLDLRGEGGVFHL